MPSETRGERIEVAPSQATTLGRPRLHLRSTTSTNDRARELALAGAPHGTLVTAAEQTAGRGRQGRRWTAPAGSSLLMSLVLRDAPPPLPLLTAVAVCDVVGPQARVKWPNDVVVKARSASPDRPALKKLAGILVEGRPQEGWAVLGIGVNVAVDLTEMPSDLRETVATLDLTSAAIEPTLADLLRALERRIGEPVESTLTRWRELDVLRGREISWGNGEPPSHGQRSEANRGRASGIDQAGHLLVDRPDGQQLKLSAGEVHILDGSERP